jgi:BlaI family transcriptional regulator, penicillinase repressor
MKSIPRPTDSELAILGVLWKRGPSTVRQVADELNQQRPVGYTTVLKLMQIMIDKGLLLREQASRSHVYRPRQSEDRTLGRIVRDLLDRAFGGSAQKLVMQALAARKASPQELDEIQKLLDQIKGA